MKWMLKAIEAEASFVYLSNDDITNATLHSDVSRAKKFDTREKADTFASNIDVGTISSSWVARSPRLVPVRVDSRSLVVELWESTFLWLEKLSVFYLIRHSVPNFAKKCPKLSWLVRIVNSSYFPEAWVLGWTVIALVVLVLVSGILDPLGWSRYIVLTIGFYRTYELAVYQINVTFLAEYRNKKRRREDQSVPQYALHGYRRLVLMSIHNYIEVLLWFAAIYAAFSDQFHIVNGDISLNNIVGALYFSVVTMTTLGYGDITPLDWVGAALVGLQVVIGVFLTLIVLARVLALMPKPISMDEFE
jgi:hypothetical protein